MSEPKRPRGSRFRDALAIVDPGACNPSGIALSIVEACREIREHETSATKALCHDPAIRLMVYQYVKFIFSSALKGILGRIET
jgi:hypothetical protein